MAIFQCDLKREKNKHNGASYLFSFTKEDLVKHIKKGQFRRVDYFFRLP